MKMKKSLLKFVNIFLAALLTVLGFSCEEPLEEYGVPNADYTVKGKVIEKDSKTPIKGIRVGFSYFPQIIAMYGIIQTDYRTYNADTTDTSGEYNLSEHFYIGEIQGDTIPVYIQDIDGAENGLYRDTVINVDFENAVKSGKAKNWYSGEYTVELDIELNKENNE